MEINKVWTREEKKILGGLNSPYKIQSFLNEIKYNSVIECRSPRIVMRNQRAHCFEGAMFAAACLRYHGYPPRVVDLKAYNDDDHVITVFRHKNFWGAIAKSNFTTLKFREPVYRSLRELAMSYFDFYFNTLGDKSLRSYSRPMDLSRYDRIHWMTTEEDLDPLGQDLESYRHYPLVTLQMIRNLKPADELLLKASLIGSNPAGLYNPGKKR